MVASGASDAWKRGGEERRSETVGSPLTLQRVGAHEVSAAVRGARDVASLARLSAVVHVFARRMLRQGIAATQVTRVVSALNDRIAARVVELELGRAAPRLPRFCWLALGSEGRREQTLATDQDNGIVFAPPPGGSVEDARAELLALARGVNASLARCGFPACDGKVMAGEPAWCRTAGEWQDVFAAWMDVPDPQALLGATIAFDFRPVFGDRTLAAGLAARLAALAPSRPRFLALLARHALARAAPIGVLGRLAVPAAGAHAGTLDLKLQGVAVFADAARVLALAHGALARGTADRLREVGARGALGPEDVAASIDALGFVQSLRLRHQCDLAAAGRPLDNRVAPAALHAVDRSFLKEALRQAKRLQQVLARRYAAEA